MQRQKNFATSSGRFSDRTDGSMNGSRIFAAVALVLAASVIAGCGRKSGLDTPYQAQVDARKEAERTGAPLPPEPEKPEEDRKFILDPLL
jgi:predicted small lipoprotein YifL